MKVFDSYARYYDLLYRDKDYRREAEFVSALIRKAKPDAHRILELGCGTGMHAVELAAQGYSIHGIDLSAGMLARANSRAHQLQPDVSRRLSFSEGDARTVRLGSKFDVVLALFHVVSYQTTNEDLAAAFDTAATHLATGGVFIFDVWYGPAVLTDRPTMRVKRLQDEIIEVTRIAEPQMHPRQNVTDVSYSVFIRHKESGQVDECKELHRMRYLFTPELEQLCQTAGFRVHATGEWLTDRSPAFDTWSVYMSAVKR